MGAGVVGAALADELSVRGWTDVTVVDQGALPRPGGSSSHAPGLVFQVNSVKTMARLARYTVEKLGAMSHEGRPCFTRTGSLEVATTSERLAELHRRHGWATSWGLLSHVLDATETVDKHDLLDPSVVLGGLYVPSDGLVHAVDAVGAQLDRARRRGVRVLDRHRVLDIRTTTDSDLGANGRPRVTAVVTDQGDLPADIVVCAAGIWGPIIAGMVGVTLPLTPLAHQLAWSTPLPALDPTSEATRPILRHQGADLYLRERFDRLGVGYYGHDPIPVAPEDIEGSELDFTPDDFAPGWAGAQALIPALRDARVAEGINGLFSFTPDNLPLLGEARGVAGFWVAEAVWVTHSAGVGRAVAEWLVEGRSESFALHECDVNRFEPYQLGPVYIETKNKRNYVEVYDVLHPLDPMVELRPMRTSPFHPRHQELGGYFLEAGGYERPQWFEANAGLLGRYAVPVPNDWAARHWSPIVGAEALHTRSAVAFYDMTPLRRLEITGPGATTLLRWLTTGTVDKAVGSVTYTLLLDADGRIRSDVTVARLGADHYQIGVNSHLDLDWLTRHADAVAAPVHIAEITGATCCVGVWGPRARDLLRELTPDLAGLRYFQGRRTHIGAAPVTALRLSYVGELGYELYTTADHGLALWDALWAAGRDHDAIAAGRGAFTSLRLEKGYRAYGLDMTDEHDPYEAGLDFAVKLDDGREFVGRDALLLRAAAGPGRRLACLTIDNPVDVVMGREPVYDGTGCVGYVTSAGYGYTVGKGIAYAWLPAALAVPGREVQIGYFDERVDAVVANAPLFDPAMTRLRA
ncbi:FAD-dependent oxidoreductase [Luedemannella helvata]|uniref:FAD-dependent oxidoreductase n=1 Tax=Luedemannella helvata TaxID=349315 RepID=A0ABP4WL86_9ACTN